MTQNFDNSDINNAIHFVSFNKQHFLNSTFKHVTEKNETKKVIINTKNKRTNKHVLTCLIKILTHF